MRFAVIALGLIGSLLVVVSVCAPRTDRTNKKIGLFLYADHTAINASRDGFISYVNENQNVFGANPQIVIRNVGGDPTKLASYADYFSTEDFDLVCALGTPCAKILAERNRRNKAVFAAPPDARLAGIVEDPEHPGKMITGVTYRPPVEKILEIMEAVFTSARRVGVPYNPAEANSRLVVDEFRETAEAAGWIVIDRPVNDPSDVATAVDAILGGVDVLFAPNDNTVHSALPAIVERASERGVPIISVDRGSVAAGALIGVGGDYYEIGRIAGELGGVLLDGADPATTPVVEAGSATRVYINQSAARRLGMRIPDEVVDQAEAVP